jgi:hypothetical protein
LAKKTNKLKIQKLVAKQFKEFKARKGSYLSDDDAKLVGEEIERLMEMNGGEVTPTDILLEAKKLRSPLHKFFEWDDSNAAREYRLQQARVLVGSIVEVVVVEGVQQEHRSFFNVKNDDNEKVYVKLDVAVSQPDYADQLLQDAENHIKQLLRVIALIRQGRK